MANQDDLAKPGEPKTRIEQLIQEICAPNGQDLVEILLKVEGSALVLIAFMLEVEREGGDAMWRERIGSRDKRRAVALAHAAAALMHAVISLEKWYSLEDDPEYCDL